MTLVRCSVLYPPCAVKECPAVYDVLRFKPYHLFRDKPLYDRLYATIREFGDVLRQCVVQLPIITVQDTMPCISVHKTSIQFIFVCHNIPFGIGLVDVVLRINIVFRHYCFHRPQCQHRMRLLKVQSAIGLRQFLPDGVLLCTGLLPSYQALKGIYYLPYSYHINFCFSKFTKKGERKSYFNSLSPFERLFSCAYAAAFVGTGFASVLAMTTCGVLSRPFATSALMIGFARVAGAELYATMNATSTLKP